MKKLAVIVLVGTIGLAGGAVADIVLTLPESVRSELGAATTVNYDRIRTLSVRVEPGSDILVANIEIFASSDAAQPAYRGTYTVDANAGTATLRIDRLGFETGLTLSPGQRTAVITNIDQHRDNVENSMISFGVVDGTQQ